MTETFGTIARNASEAAYSQLWKGLQIGLCPAVGVTGETVRDFSGSKNNGTLQVVTAANAWQQAGKGWSIALSGATGQRVSFAEYSLGNFTVSSWVYFSAIAGSGHVVAGGPFAHYAPYITSTTMYWRAGGTYGAITHSLPTGRWVHVLSSRSGATVSAYVDGQAIGTATVSGTIRIGAVGNYDLASSIYSVDGYLGNHLIYDRPSTAAQAKLIYSLGPSADVLRVRRRRVHAAPAAAIVYARRTPRHRTILGGGLR